MAGANSPVLSPGDRIDRYTIESLLGQGGMGAVYQAMDERLDRRVALKIVQLDPDADQTQRDERKARLVREAKVVAAFEHPNAVNIFDIGEVDGMPYIAMELVDGKTLRELGTAGEASVEQRLTWMSEVAGALAAAHRARIVHRDVKPENVMVRKDGRVKVLDFGIARRARGPVDGSAPTEDSGFATLTAEGVQVGTPMYMAPEQIRGEEVDGRVDQFAWAVMTYELLSGRPPWKANDALGLVASILTDEPTPLSDQVPGVTAAASGVVSRALSKLPSDRYEDMDALVAALDGALGRHTSGAPTGVGGAPTGTKPWGSRGPPWVPTPPPGPGGSFRPPSTSMELGLTLMQRYSREELRDVLERALARQQLEDETFSHAELLEAAREIGLDDATLTAAARDMRIREQPRLARRRSKQGLKRHFAIWLAGAVFFFLLDLVSSGLVWFWYPVISWGFGLGVHAATVLSPVDPKPPRRRIPRASRRHTDQELDNGVQLLLTQTRYKPGMRVADADSGVTRERRAEDEAAAETEGRLRRLDL